VSAGWYFKAVTEIEALVTTVGQRVENFRTSISLLERAGTIRAGSANGGVLVIISENGSGANEKMAICGSVSWHGSKLIFHSAQKNA